MSARKLILLTVFTLAALLAQAQSNLPKTTVAGHEFYYYDTSAGESIYGIAAKLGITKDEIIKNNPDAADGITSGMRLYFPAEVEDANTVTSNVTELKTQNSALQHDVKQGETLYGLAKTYGTTVDELIALNPGSENGIKIGQKLMIPSSRTNEQISVNADKQVHDAFSQNTPQATLAGSDATFLTINDGEDIYSIAKQYNASVESILTNNPGLNPDEYVTGTKIKVVPNTALPFNYERMSRRNYKYEVQRGETYASIAKANGITEEELKAANPDLKKVKKGKIITLPKPYAEQVIGEMATIPVDELRAYYQPRINDLYENLVQKRLESEVNIALVLPFQLHKSAPPKQAYLYTDFYKGFLLALDSVSHITDKHINLKVYDTQHNLNVTDSILSLPELKAMNMIIAPASPSNWHASTPSVRLTA